MHPRLLLFAFAFLLAASAAPGQEEKLKEIRGAIRQLDLKAGAVTLQLPYGANAAIACTSGLRLDVRRNNPFPLRHISQSATNPAQIAQSATC